MSWVGIVKYAAIVCLGCIVVVFVALTYESQLLASVTAAAVGLVTALIVLFAWNKDRLDKRPRL